MASALLASRNEPYWGDRKVYMRKNLNSRPNSWPVHNPNPNPNHGFSVPSIRIHGSDCREENGDALAVANGVASDDSSSLNRRLIDVNHQSDAGLTGATASYVTFNISACSKKELRELKRRFVSELEQIRSVTSRIELRELQTSARSLGHCASGIYCGGREVTSSTAFQQNQLTFLDPFSGRDVKDSESKTEPYGHSVAASAAAANSKKLLSTMMKKCGQILSKLMKHKGGVWFNSPVDVEGMGLHDYRQIVKNPMDLGTVKSRLNGGFYLTPLDFAQDIRLTFNNALLYNPETHEVHKLAAMLLRQFEALFVPAYNRYEKQQLDISRQGEDKQISSWCRPSLAIEQRQEPLPSLPPPVGAAVSPKPLVPPSLAQPPIPTRTVVGRQPKPKAKDPNKRPMSDEERQKLSSGLQNIPQEKMSQLMQILKKRNVEIQLEGDEIILDFEGMDTETLWELDRFVCNFKKLQNKIMRQEAMAGKLVSSVPAVVDKLLVVDETSEALAGKKIKKVDPADEEIDIGDEMPPANYPSVEIEKDDVRASGSSSSDSDSSSSSGTHR
ncbi:Transcription factor GTE3, chloroplastic [Apostasia shenzhenica]|uniref:Transcription factor GTE3, chloroplastic n=1 Tax=Apostasia shenzhenica TaxID=1088818 RepID=A0A2I0ABI8_9ASPA|nr:Transcription factor GTE3, chloroplastic [Apostasia shenzhenica]